MKKVKDIFKRCSFAFSFSLLGMEAIHEPLPGLRPIDTALTRQEPIERKNPFDDEGLHQEGAFDQHAVNSRRTVTTPTSFDSGVENTPTNGDHFTGIYKGTPAEDLRTERTDAVERIAKQHEHHAGIAPRPVKDALAMIEALKTHLSQLKETEKRQNISSQEKAHIANIIQKIEVELYKLEEPSATAAQLTPVTKEHPEGTQKEPDDRGTNTLMTKKPGFFARLKNLYAARRVWRQKDIQKLAQNAFKDNPNGNVATIVAELRAGNFPDLTKGVMDQAAYNALLVKVYDILLGQKLRTPAMIKAFNILKSQRALSDLRIYEVSQPVSEPTFKPKKPSPSEEKAIQKATARLMNNAAIKQSLTTMIPKSGQYNDAILQKVTQTVVTELRAGRFPIDAVRTVKALNIPGVSESAIKNVVRNIFTAMVTNDLMTEQMKNSQDFSQALMDLWNKPELAVSPRPVIVIHDSPEEKAEKFKEQGLAAMQKSLDQDQATLNEVIIENESLFAQASETTLKDFDEKITAFSKIAESLLPEWQAFLDTLGDDPEKQLAYLKSLVSRKDEDLQLEESVKTQLETFKEFLARKKEYQKLLAEIKNSISTIKARAVADAALVRQAKVTTYKESVDTQFEQFQGFLEEPGNKAMLENPDYTLLKDWVRHWTYRIESNNKDRIKLYADSLLKAHFEEDLEDAQKNITALETGIKAVVSSAAMLESQFLALEKLAQQNKDFLEKQTELKNQVTALMEKAASAKKQALDRIDEEFAFDPEKVTNLLEEAADEIEASGNALKELISDAKMKALAAEREKRKKQKAQERQQEEQQRVKVKEANTAKFVEFKKLLQENNAALKAQLQAEPETFQKFIKLKEAFLTVAESLQKSQFAGPQEQQAQETFNSLAIKLNQFITKAKEAYDQQQLLKAEQDRAAQQALQEAESKAKAAAAQAERTRKLEDFVANGGNRVVRKKRDKQVVVFDELDGSQKGALTKPADFGAFMRSGRTIQPENPSLLDQLHEEQKPASTVSALDSAKQKITSFWQGLLAKQQKSVTYKTYTDSERQQARSQLVINLEAAGGQLLKALGNVTAAIKLLSEESNFLQAASRRSFATTAEEKAYKQAMARLWFRMANPEINLLPEQSEEQFNKNLLNAYSIKEELNADGQTLLQRAFENMRDGTWLDRDVAPAAIEQLAVTAKALTSVSSLYAFAQDQNLLHLTSFDAFKKGLQTYFAGKEIENLEPRDAVLLMVYRDKEDLLQRMFDTLTFEQLCINNKKKVVVLGQPLLTKVFIQVMKSSDIESKPQEVIEKVITVLNNATSESGITSFASIYQLDMSNERTFGESVLKNIVQASDVDLITKVVWERILKNSETLNKVFELAQKAEKQRAMPKTAKGASSSSVTEVVLPGGQKPGLSIVDTLKGAAQKAGEKAQDALESVKTKLNGPQPSAEQREAEWKAAMQKASDGILNPYRERITAEWAKPLLERALTIARASEPRGDLPETVLDLLLAEINKDSSEQGVGDLVKKHSIRTGNQADFAADLQKVITTKLNNPISESVWQAILENKVALAEIFNLAQEAQRKAAPVRTAITDLFSGKQPASSEASEEKSQPARGSKSGVGQSAPSEKPKNSAWSKMREGVSGLATKAKNAVTSALENAQDAVRK